MRGKGEVHLSGYVEPEVDDGDDLSDEGELDSEEVSEEEHEEEVFFFIIYKSPFFYVG